MEQTNVGSDGGYGPRPPPYNLHDNGESSYTGVSYQVGKGNVAVISPPGIYNNVGNPEGVAAAGGNQQYGEARPDYSNGLEDSSFSNAALRRGFIRKVYLTLMIQLLVTVGIICAFLYWDTLRKWVWDNSWFSYSMMAAVTVLIVALSCCDNLRRQVPLNFIALGLFVSRSSASQASN